MSEDTNYEIYRNVRTMEDFFTTWENNGPEEIGEKIKKVIYDKYISRCNILHRDNFECQNTECEYPDSELTIHHVKFKMNGGKDTERNRITVCKTCHKAFHRAKRGLTFANEERLPTRLRGATFMLKAPVVINWKKRKAEMRAFRKNLKMQGIKNDQDWEIISQILIWIFHPIEEFDD